VENGIRIFYGFLAAHRVVFTGRKTDRKRAQYRRQLAHRLGALYQHPVGRFPSQSNRCFSQALVIQLFPLQEAVDSIHHQHKHECNVSVTNNNQKSNKATVVVLDSGVEEGINDHCNIQDKMN
jgi:hypothetical protein